MAAATARLSDMELSVRSSVPPVDDSEPPLRRLGLLPRLVGRLLFRHARMDPGAVEYLKELAARGPIVYVMRSRSVIEFLLVAYRLAVEELPLPQYVSGLPTLLLHPVTEIVATLWRRIRSGRALRQRFDAVEEARLCRETVAQGACALVFMRTRAPGVGLRRGQSESLDRVRTGSEFLRELVINQWASPREVALVPVAVVHGRGFKKKDSRFATLVYSAREAPNELRRFASLAWNRREISILAGKDIALGGFIDRYRSEGAERVTRRLSRALRLFLHREERLVVGPTLLPKRTVRDIVLSGSDYDDTVERIAEAEKKPLSAIHKRAARYFDEMAADYNGIFFGLLAAVFNRVWLKIFGGLEHRGLERVVACARQHPIVLVPCHRSHFDYLILSYLFHQEYLSPPHIAAGINLSFWPMGPLFRGAGAYFIRRTFGDDALYKLVFRNYLTFLIRDGYTQEFFIEGGRSRTGKIMSPKLGMLSALVNAYLSGVRRDLYFVPVSIHYGRVVEEQAYARELGGEEKEAESLGSLIRARSVLRQFYGSVYVSFAEPISLRDAIGDRLDAFRAVERAGDEASAEDQNRLREFVSGMGGEILRQVNAVTVAGATGVSSTVLLSSDTGALRYDEFLQRCVALSSYLEARGILMTSSLEDAHRRKDWRKSCEFLASGGLIAKPPANADIVHVPPNKRAALDFYKNNIVHFFVVPSLVVRELSRGRTPDECSAALEPWLRLYELEFPALPFADLGAEVNETIAALRACGAMTDNAVDREHPLTGMLLSVLDNFDEAYWLVARELQHLPAEGISEKRWLVQLATAHKSAVLLGEVRRPESGSTVTFANALVRFEQLGCIERVAVPKRGKRGSDRTLRLIDADGLASWASRFSRN